VERGVFDTKAAGGDDEATERVRTITRVITESPALLARERQVFAEYSRSLAALIAEETGAAAGDVLPAAVANALIGVHRSLIDYVRERTLTGARASQISRGVRAQAKKAFAQLEEGLADFAVREP
jgi:hypothetical protein